MKSPAGCYLNAVNCLIERRKVPWWHWRVRRDLLKWAEIWAVRAADVPMMNLTTMLEAIPPARNPSDSESAGPR